ncbi:MAG: hypothetical protein JF607_04680 [Burkholderiales bacterium]|jgi:DNA-binding transcriptional LysR family regulator|nr:hypothetical protein [Burkholderiales bacterium]
MQQMLDDLDTTLLRIRGLSGTRLGEVTRRHVTWKDMNAYDYISVAKSSGNRLLLDQALAGVSGRPDSIYETEHVTTMLGLVEAGLGIAAVPSLAMPGKDHPLLVSIPLNDPVVTRQVGLIRRKSRTLSPAAQQLYDSSLK